MANTKPTNKNNQSTSSTNLNRVDNELDALDSIYNQVSSNKELHKSFDFSNVGIYDNHSNFVTGSDSNFRHFHQMRLYIQIPTYFKKAKPTVLANTDTLLLTSNLPDSISYTLGSQWQAPLSSFGNGVSNLLMQMGGNLMGLGSSGVPRATSLKIWSGSDPLSLNLKIPVIDDGSDNSKTNLMEALEILGMLALPTLDGGSFYVPPPSPLNATITYAKGIGKNSETDQLKLNTGKVGRILLQLGGILLVDNCVIETVSVNYPNTKVMIKHNYEGSNVNYGKTGAEFLHPLLAEITLKVSTIESTTANAYAKMLWGKPQGGSGKYSFDASRGVLGVITGGIYSGIKNTVDMISGK